MKKIDLEEIKSILENINLEAVSDIPENLESASRGIIAMMSRDALNLLKDE